MSTKKLIAIIAASLAVVMAGGVAIGVAVANKSEPDEPAEVIAVSEPDQVQSASAHSDTDVSFIYVYTSEEVSEDISEEMTKAEDTSFADMKNAVAGDIIKYGKIISDEGIERSVEWVVLKNDGKRIFVTAREAVGKRPINRNNHRAADWETSDLNAWLNGEFLTTVFSDEETASISLARYESIGYGVSIVDEKISILSKYEYETYVQGVSKVCSQISVNGDDWWLRTRSTGYNNIYCLVTYESSSERILVDAQGYECLIRPCMYINYTGSNDDYVDYRSEGFTAEEVSKREGLFYVAVLKEDGLFYPVFDQRAPGQNTMFKTGSARNYADCLVSMPQETAPYIMAEGDQIVMFQSTDSILIGAYDPESVDFYPIFFDKKYNDSVCFQRRPSWRSYNSDITECISDLASDYWYEKNGSNDGEDDSIEISEVNGIEFSGWNEFVSVVEDLGYELINLGVNCEGERYECPYPVIKFKEGQEPLKLGYYRGVDFYELAIDHHMTVQFNKIRYDVNIEKTKNGYFILDISEWPEGTYVIHTKNDIGTYTNAIAYITK